MITIYTITYNESLFIQFMIDHYRSRFPNCNIVVYDNCSTDNTIQIALANGCEIRTFDTNNQIQDTAYLSIKNNCWQQAPTDWVLICDIDELLEINASDLSREEQLGSTIIKFKGFNMINLEPSLDLASIKYGVRDAAYDKQYLFNKTSITRINYKPGCHDSTPRGKVKYSDQVYLAYHYRYLSEDHLVSRYKEYASRLSRENKKQGWGAQYLWSESKIRDFYQKVKAKAIKIIS